MTIKEIELMSQEEYDLQDKTRMDDTYDKIEGIVNDITNLNVFPSLVWVWVWNLIKDKLEYYGVAGDYYQVNPDLTLKDIFSMLWEDSDSRGFTLEYGVEDLDDSIQDWMTDRNILISVEEDEDE